MARGLRVDGLPPLPKSLSGLLHSAAGGAAGGWRHLERLYAQKSRIQDELNRGGAGGGRARAAGMRTKPPNLDAALALLRKEMVRTRRRGSRRGTLSFGPWKPGLPSLASHGWTSSPAGQLQMLGFSWARSGRGGVRLPGPRRTGFLCACGSVWTTDGRPGPSPPARQESDYRHGSRARQGEVLRSGHKQWV